MKIPLTNGIISDLSILIENISNPEPLPVSPETIPSSVGDPESLPKFYTIPLDIAYKVLESPVSINDNYKTLDGKLKVGEQKLTAYILDLADSYSTNTLNSKPSFESNSSYNLNKSLIKSRDDFLGTQRNSFGDINLDSKSNTLSQIKYFQSPTTYDNLTFTSDNAGFSNKFISPYKF